MAPQLYSPVGLDLKLVKRALNAALKFSELRYPGNKEVPRSIPV